MGKRKTHEQYVDDVASINPNIEVAGKYIDSRTKILHRCKIDGHEWYVKPNDILNGHGCPVCFGNAKKTHEQYVKDVAKANPNIEVVGTYINNSTNILHRCKIDGFEWYAKPNNILSGYGCPQCKIGMITGRKRKEHEVYIEEVSCVNSDIEVVEQYITSQTPILHRCKMCGNEWYVRPSDILCGYGCPQCSCSRGERDVKQWLDKHNIIYVHQKRFNDCRDIITLPFDFYLPEFNIIIEYNGIQHYKPIDYFGGNDTFEYTKKHDKIKRDYCASNGINLIDISYLDDIHEKLNMVYNKIITKEVAA